MDLVLKTEKQEQRENKYKDLYNDYLELSKNPKSKKTAIIQHLGKKYGYKSQKSIYDIINKVERGSIDL